MLFLSPYENDGSIRESAVCAAASISLPSLDLFFKNLRSRLRRKLFLSLVAAVFVSSVVLAADEAPPAAPAVGNGSIPSGYVWLSGGTVALGIGYTWAHGTLYNSRDQKQYKFKLSGVSVVDVGGAGINAEGEVYNLTTPADLNGNYSAYTAGITVGEGGSIAWLKNEKGVVIALHSQTGGLRFNLAVSGVKLTLQAS